MVTESDDRYKASGKVLMVDDVVARGYGSSDQPYHRARPAYPPEAIDALLRVLELQPGAHVVELGAGTGICTRQLAGRGLRVTALEPVAGMRSRIGDCAATVAATAEQTGLADGVADAVIAATAWHWFDGAAALAQSRRILKPGKGLGLLWNSYDESVPWVAALARIADSRRPDRHPSERTGRWRTPIDEAPDWLPLRREQFTNPWTTTADGIVERVLSSSVISALDRDERQHVRGEVTDLLAAHNVPTNRPVELPYVTSVYWTLPVADR